MRSNVLFTSVRLGSFIVAIGALAGCATTQKKEAQLAKELTIDLDGGVNMEFVLIPAGAFTMGSDKSSDEKPAHKVTITKPFYVGKYLVTQEQWEKVMGSNPSIIKGAKNPVEEVSWEDCQSFMAKLKDKVPRQTFRLPTEAEWEYACRAGTATEHGFGDSDSGSRSHPVGEKKPNAWGLYDMHGNIWEWCADWYAANYHGGDQTDPFGPSSGHFRVLRGGSWGDVASGLRSAVRAGFSPSGRGNFIGVRVVAAVGTP